MGTMGVFSRKTGFDAELITFFRLFFGALFLTGFLLFARQLKHLKQWPTWPVLINGLMLAGFIISYVQAMYYTTMANAIMVLYLAPLVASIYAHFLLKERLDFKSFLLICTALLGFSMMMEFKFDLSSSDNFALGIFFAVLSLICYTAFILINRVIDARIHVYNRTFFQLASGAFCLLPFCLSTLPDISINSMPWLLGVGFIPGFLGILLAVIALETLPAATFGTLAYFEPIFVVTLGWFLFGEKLNTLQLSGCAMILVSGIVKGILATSKSEGSEAA